MTLEVVEYKRLNNSSFAGLLKDPAFCITILEEGRLKEIAIQIKGEFSSYPFAELTLFEEEAYRNYKILKDYLLSEKGQDFLDRIDADESSLILGLYKVLVYRHSVFGWFKKKLLVILEYLRYYSGKLGI